MRRLGRKSWDSCGPLRCVWRCCDILRGEGLYVVVSAISAMQVLVLIGVEAEVGTSSTNNSVISFLLC
jgi:hypothetical protein